jgi:hypothetical protein
MNDSAIPKATRSTAQDAYYNRFAVQAKLNSDQYYALIRYCKKANLNINKFIKMSISFFLLHHG